MPVLKNKKAVVVKLPNYRISYASLDSGIKIVLGGQIIFSLGCFGSAACCGLKELGGINCTNVHIGKYDAQLDEALKSLINDSTHYNEDQEDGEIIAIIANLIDNEACKVLKEAFVRTKTFKCIKEFTNANSGNVITTWISNN